MNTIVQYIDRENLLGLWDTEYMPNLMLFTADVIKSKIIGCA